MRFHGSGGCCSPEIRVKVTIFVTDQSRTLWKKNRHCYHRVLLVAEDVSLSRSELDRFPGHEGSASKKTSRTRPLLGITVVDSKAII